MTLKSEMKLNLVEFLEDLCLSSCKLKCLPLEIPKSIPIPIPIGQRKNIGLLSGVG